MHRKSNKRKKTDKEPEPAEIDVWQEKWETELRSTHVAMFGRVVAALINNWDKTPIPTDSTSNMRLLYKIVHI